MPKKLTTGGLLRSLIKWGFTGEAPVEEIDTLKKGLTNGQEQEAKVIETTAQEAPQRRNSEHEGTGSATEAPKTPR